MRRLSHKLILVHKGALGDFLQTWPAIYSLVESKKFSTIIWAGAERYFLWLAPLGLTLANFRERVILDKLYGATSLPDELKGYSIIWFGLNRPPTAYQISDLFFLQGIRNREPVWKNYLRILKETLCISSCKDWMSRWRRLFPRKAGKIIAIFPGSGHRLKNWPMDRFEDIASRLEKAGEKPVFILGPVEKEKKLVPQGRWTLFYPSSFTELMEILKETKICIGNDSGPLHLAGFMGIPSLSIFGPTDPLRWSPLEARVVRSTLCCAPCTSTIEIKCNTMSCLLEISTNKVWKETEILLNSSL